MSAQSIPIPQGAQLVPLDQSQGGTVPIPQGATLQPLDQQGQQQPPDQPGFFKRLGQSLGIPTSAQELQAAQPSLAEMIGGPAVTAGKMALNYGKTAYQGIKEGGQEAFEAGQNIGEGQPAGPNIGKAGSGLMHMLLQGTPIVGPSIDTAGQDVSQKNYAGAAGGLTGVAGQILGPKLFDKGSAALGDAANKLADSSLGVTALDRRRLPVGQKNAIGQSALELKGGSSAELADQAQSRVADLSQQMEALANQSTQPVSLKPALDTLNKIEATADAQNDRISLKVVDKIREQLTKKYTGGQAIPQITTARQALDLKRGIGKLKNWDSASEAAAASPIVDQVYGALDGELDAALPGSEDLNRQLSLMLKVGDKSEALLNKAGIAQSAIDRISRHTGGLLAGTGVGTSAGLALGGPMGGAVGGAAGALVGPFIQEAIASPATRMKIARTMNPGSFSRDVSSGMSGGALSASPMRGANQAGQSAPSGQPDDEFWQDAAEEYKKRHGRL